MTAALDLLWLPFLACLVLAGIHAYLGLHVLARGVIFVDLALAQVAALGMTAALLAGHAPGSDATYYYGLAFTAAGAAVFAVTTPWGAPGAPQAPQRSGRPGQAVAPLDPAGSIAAATPWGAPGAPQAPQRSGRPGQAVAPSEALRSVPHEAIIGIVYAVAAALTVLVLDRVATGGEQIKQLLVGSLLSVTGEDVARVTALYAAVGLFHWLARRPFLAISTGAGTRYAPLWDFAFYFTFGLVVTSSVRIAGVLLVFSYLIVPAVIGAWLADSIGRRLMIGWSIGLVVSAAGLGASYALDLPTGATIVAAFGAVLAGVALAVGVARAIQAVRREGARALAGLGIVFGGVILTAGVMLAAFPAADHPWLDALERAVPAMQDAFLTPYERRVAADSRTFIARADAELGRLRALAVDVQWGRATLPDEQRERLRQFIAGRSEIAAGDRMVLRTLARHARERQRWALGLPMAAVGGALAVLGARAGRRRAAPRPPAAISGETRAAR